MRWSIRISILLGMAGSAILCPAGAMAETIVVPPEGSIGEALQVALPGDTVLLECGLFREQGLVLPEGVILRSESGEAGCVIIVSDASASILTCTALTHAARIEGIIFRGDPTVREPAVAQGGGVYCAEASPTFVNCRFEDLEAAYGGAVFCTTSSAPWFENCVFRGNHARAVGGAMAVVDTSEPLLDGCLVIKNSAESAGGAFNVAKNSSVGLLRSTVAENEGASAYWDHSDAVLTSSILVDSWLGDYDGRLKPDCSDLWVSPPESSIDPTFGFYISEDPLFCTTLAGDYQYNLDEASPCTPEAFPDCGGMGAMPVGCAMSPVDDPPPADEILPLVTRLQENFPNPFNPRTTIKYDVSRPGHVTVAVFDLAGRLVKRLVDESLAAGHHQVVWQGDGGDGRSVAAGVYFVRLKTAAAVDTRRMTLIK